MKYTALGNNNKKLVYFIYFDVIHEQFKSPRKQEIIVGVFEVFAQLCTCARVDMRTNFFEKIKVDAVDETMSLCHVCQSFLMKF